MATSKAKIVGWILLSRDVLDVDIPKFDRWHLAWHEVFQTKKEALQFTRDNDWSKPFRAMKFEVTP